VYTNLFRSPALIPKPNDWSDHINISGFYFLSLASDYTPPADLEEFLNAGPPPIYIGFGSIVVDDPNEMTRMIFDAVRLTGQRALVSKGWGGLGAEELGIPESVYMIGNCPHDWLFQRVSCVIHHGGAGTTAAGIALGRPTAVIPFFGDQPFWGAMIAKAGAGPDPIPYKQLNAEKLAGAINKALEPTTLEKAAELGAKIRGEQGTEEGALSFQRQLKADTMCCSLAPDRVAVFRLKRTRIKLSALAFNVLNTEGLVELEDVKL
jgi:UDP:flavonoid glycosyltransferase YjiC (YdhE family)